MKKIAAIGNCQMTAITNALYTNHNFKENFSITLGHPVHVITADQVKDFYHHVASCDILLCSYVHAGYRNNLGVDTGTLISLLPSQAKIIVVPSIHWEGLTPELFYFKNDDGTKNTELFDYHNKIIFYSYTKGYTIKQAAELITSSESITFNPNLVQNAHLSLAKREASLIQFSQVSSAITPVIFSDFILENYTAHRLFWTFNHPTNYLLNYITNKICNIISGEIINIETKNEYLANSFFPIHPAIYKSLKCIFQNPQIFKVRNTVYTPDEIIEKYFDFYDKNQKAVHINIEECNSNILEICTKVAIYPPQNIEKAPIEINISDKITQMKNIRKEIEILQPWNQKIDFGDNIFSPGRWDVKAQFDMLAPHLKIEDGTRILDCGSNGGGIAFECAKRGAKVTTLEIGAKYIAQQNLYVSYMKHKGESFINNVKICKDTLFNAHTYGEFDIIFMLGLIYHFRYPQLFLDYCSLLSASTFVFSTQTTNNPNPVMQNRCLKYKRDSLMGYEPSRSLFELMLVASGFSIEHRFYPNGIEFTNDTYIICKKNKSANIKAEDIAAVCQQSILWT